MVIILDTTELFRDPHLSGPDWLLVATFLERVDAHLIVPEVVLDEAARHFESKLTQALDAVSRAQGQIKKLVPDALLPLPAMDVPQLQGEYRQALEARLGQMGAMIAPHSVILLDTILQRSLTGRKPFGSHTDRGFRDAVLWESALRAIPEGTDQVLLISSNTSEFSDGRELAGDLRDDLVVSGLAPESVHLCIDVRDLVERFVQPLM